MSLPVWLADPELAELWRVVHDRLEQRGLDWRGRATVLVSSPAQRRALGSLLGRTIAGDRVTVDVNDLDERTHNAGGLVAVVTKAVGPIEDRRSNRQRAVAAREEPVAAAREELPSVPWAEAWLGSVRRLGPSPSDASLAARLLARLLTSHEVVSRQDLAVGVAGDAHALDDGTALSTLVLRGLALAARAEMPDSAAARRELWTAAGVLLDGVSTTCLALRLPLCGGRLAARLADGDPLHVSARDLARSQVVVEAGTRVLVCENPRVLEAIADLDLDVAMVCGSGNPNLVVMDLLTALQRSGALLRYHGDFDWPGVAIANRLVASVEVQPWLMSAAHYAEVAATAELALRGSPVDAVWDSSLRGQMETLGRAVHEEAVLPLLLSALKAGEL